MKLTYNKKTIMTIAFILVLILTVNTSSLATTSQTKISKTDCTEYISVIQRLIFPFLSKVVKEKYSKYTYIDIYDIDITDIKTETTGNIKLTVQVMPYKGAHNTISKDEISLLLEVYDIILIDYQTLETY